MLNHSLVFAQAIAHNIQVQPKYADAILRAAVDVPATQRQIFLFWTFVKTFASISDTKYQILVHLSNRVSALMHDTIRMMPPRDAVKEGLRVFTQDLRVDPVPMNEASTGLSRNQHDIILKLLNNIHYRRHIRWLSIGSKPLLIVVAAVDGVPVTKDIFELVASLRIANLKPLPKHKALTRDHFIHATMLAIIEDESYEAIIHYFEPLMDQLLTMHHLEIIDPLSWRPIALLPLAMADSAAVEKMFSVSSARSSRPLPWSSYSADQLRNFNQHCPINLDCGGAQVSFPSKTRHAC